MTATELVEFLMISHTRPLPDSSKLTIWYWPGVPTGMTIEATPRNQIFL